MDSSHGTRPRRSQSVRRRTIDDTLSGQLYFILILCSSNLAITGHGGRIGEAVENKADYPRAGSNVSSCRYQLLAIDLPDQIG